jgi:hypothetical protein
MSFTADLLETAPNRAAVSKYTSMNGLVYLGAGALLMVWPGAVQTLLFDQPFAGHEEGLFRAIGMAVAVIVRRPFRRPTIRCLYSARPLHSRSSSWRTAIDCWRISSYVPRVCISRRRARRWYVGDPKARDVKTPKLTRPTGYRV